MRPTPFSFVKCFWIVLLFIGVTGMQSASALEEKLTMKSIKTLLSDLGYNFSSKRYSNRLPYYLVEVKQDDKTYKTQVSLSKNGKYVWVITGLVFLKDDQDLSKEKLTKLLEANYNQSLLSYFSFNSRTKHLRLKSALYNDQVEPQDLQRAIEESADLAHRTKNLWNPNKWTN